MPTTGLFGGFLIWKINIGRSLVIGNLQMIKLEILITVRI